MRLILSNLTIELDSQEEIRNFWNVIMFALDLHAEKTKKGEVCMSQDELSLAQKLEKITNIYRN